MEDPTYYHLGDHTETIQIDYDPTRITYRELLDIFWSSHTPTSLPWSRQYWSIIFYHDEEQKKLAEATKAEREAAWGRSVYTEIVPYSRFYLAEDYHQKHDLGAYDDFLGWFRAIYPDEKDFVDSTAVARLNGYLGGNGTQAQLKAELDDLGLAPGLHDRLWGLVAGSDAPPAAGGTASCATGACG